MSSSSWVILLDCDLVAVQEAEHELGEALWLPERRGVAATVEHLEARSGYAPRIGLAIGEGEQAILAAPHDERRRADAPQPARELSMLLGRAPEKPGGGLAPTEDGLEAIWRRRVRQDRR